LNDFGPEDDQMPQQFKYEAAECRRFSTLDNILRPESIWASAADTMFDGGDCSWVYEWYWEFVAKRGFFSLAAI
jgi:hypothetical protein